MTSLSEPRVPLLDAPIKGVWPDPLAPSAPLPHRKVIRSWLLPLAERSTWRAFLLLAFDYLLLASLLAGVVFSIPPGSCCCAAWPPAS